MEQSSAPSPIGLDSGSTSVTPTLVDLTLLNLVEVVLKNPRQIVAQIAGPKTVAVSASLAVVATLSALVYGLVIGSFAGGSQWWIAPSKVCAGMAVATLICYPSLYIFSCLSGTRARPSHVLGVLFAMMTLANLLLIGFAPVAWIFSQSTDSVACVGFFHLLFWTCALLFGCRFISIAFQELGGRTTSLVGVWTLIFLAVTLQMTTSLRPLLGRADTLLPERKLFFLTYWLQGGSEK